MRGFRAADRLAAILDGTALPPRARDLGERVRARLDRPVRIAVIGRPGAGKRRIVDGLLGGAVLPRRAGLPPLDLAFGPGETAEAVFADGTRRRLTPAGMAEVDPYALAFLRVEAHLPLLEKIGFTIVPLEGEGEAPRAALDWACARADMVLWCASDPDSPDAALWPALPEALQDHAFLAVTDPESARASPAQRARAAEHFREVRNLADGPAGADRIAALRAALLTHVSLARREDLEGALAFLDQYLARPDRSRAARHARPAGTAQADRTPTGQPASRGDAPKPAAEGAGAPEQPAATPPAPQPQVAGPAEGPAARIVDLLAARAASLSELCAAGRSADALDLCAETLEAAGSLAANDADAADGLADALGEAGDLMLLMQLEGGGTALEDGLALMLQVRRDCEARLAA